MRNLPVGSFDIEKFIKDLILAEKSVKIHKSVLIAVRVHPFPFRTRKLSSPVPTILSWKRLGKIGQCQHKKPTVEKLWVLFYYSNVD